MRQRSPNKPSDKEEQYRDYHDYLDNLRRICRRWPGGEKSKTPTKKAVLVTFTVTTRVLVDIPAGFSEADASVEDSDGLQDEAIGKAAEKVIAGIAEYLASDNAEVHEDKECPYDPQTDK